MPHGVTGPGRPIGDLAFAAAVRMVVRVHDRAANRRAPAHVALTAGLTDFNVLVIDVAYLADGGHAVNGYVTQLAGGQTDQRIGRLPLPSAAPWLPALRGQLRALAGIKLHIVDERTGRDVGQRQCVAGLDIRVSARARQYRRPSGPRERGCSASRRLHTEAGRYGRSGSGSYSMREHLCAPCRTYRA